MQLEIDYSVDGLSNENMVSQPSAEDETVDFEMTFGIAGYRWLKRCFQVVVSHEVRRVGVRWQR